MYLLTHNFISIRLYDDSVRDDSKLASVRDDSKLANVRDDSKLASVRDDNWLEIRNLLFINLILLGPHDSVRDESKLAESEMTVN